MKKMILTLIAFSSLSISAQAGDLTDKLAGAYEMDLVKPTLYTGTGLVIGGVVAGTSAKALGNDDLKFIDLSKAEYCNYTPELREPSATMNLSTGSNGDEVASDSKMLFGLTSAQAKWVTQIGLETFEARIYHLPTDKRVQALRKQREENCPVLQKSGAKQFTGFRTMKFRARLTLAEGAKNTAAKIVDSAKTYLGEGFTVAYDYRNNLIQIEADKDTVMGVHLRPVEKK